MHVADMAYVRTYLHVILGGGNVHLICSTMVHMLVHVTHYLLLELPVPHLPLSVHGSLTCMYMHATYMYM